MLDAGGKFYNAYDMRNIMMSTSWEQTQEDLGKIKEIAEQRLYELRQNPAEGQENLTKGYVVFRYQIALLFILRFLVSLTGRLP